MTTPTPTGFGGMLAAHDPLPASLRTVLPAELDPYGARTRRGPVVRTRTKRMGGTRWEGVLIGREWDAGFTEGEYLLLMAGGTRARLGTPDKLTRDGRPLWYHSVALRKQIERDLDRLCRDGFEVPIILSKNVACNAGRLILLDFLGNVGGIAGMSYFAVGTGAGTPGATDTQLFAEAFRKQVSNSTISGNQINDSTFFGTTEGNFSYTEAGLFGNGATGTANSGTIFNHAPYTYNKTSQYGLTNNAIITLS